MYDNLKQQKYVLVLESGKELNFIYRMQAAFIL